MKRKAAKPTVDQRANFAKPKKEAAAQPDHKIALTFEQHVRVMRALRAGQPPYCPRCNSDFDLTYPGGCVQAVCWGCGATVREIPSHVGTLTL